MLLLRGSDTLCCRAALRLEEVFALDDPTGSLQAVWKVKEQLRALLRTGSLDDAAAAKNVLEELVKAAARPENQQALPHSLQMVERDRGTGHHRRHHRQGRGQQHSDQEHQANRPRYRNATNLRRPEWWRSPGSWPPTSMQVQP